MAGIPLILLNPALQDAAGLLFDWKVLLLIAVVLLSIVTYRPFCRYLCPLGAIYAPFNKFALYRYHVDEKKCTACKVCQQTCKLDIPVYKTPNSPDCIRCGDCRRACPKSCITSTLENGAFKKCRKSR
jgi:polyferredoxin